MRPQRSFWLRLQGTLINLDETMQRLAQALAARDMTLLAATMHPAFDWLTGDSDFRQLRSRCEIWAQRADPVAGAGAREPSRRARDALRRWRYSFSRIGARYS
jgi:hypothetical protein